MRKSHRRKVADRREKRLRRWTTSRRRIRESLYRGLTQDESPLLLLLRDVPRNETPKWMTDGKAWLRENMAGEAFISALVAAAAGESEQKAKFLSSMEALNPGLLERVRQDCKGTGDTK